MPNMTIEESERFYNEILSEDERHAVSIALKSDTPWTHETFDEPIKGNLINVKNKIKNFHLNKTTVKCCYCRRSLLDATIESDREHIVPKSKKKHLSYDIFNISIACKRCNMTYKGEKTEHIVEPDTVDIDLRNEDRYRIPHPNIDTYEDHIVRRSIESEGQIITTYHKKTKKGSFLYKFVRLDRLCINEIDTSQGGSQSKDAIESFFGIPIEGA